MTNTETAQLVGAQGLREVVIAAGEDAETFLQGQLSQDIAVIEEGASAWSLLLHPQGKIAAYLRVTRLDGGRFGLDVDTGWSEQMIARLERFKLRTKCDLELSPWTSLTLAGPGANEVVVTGAELDVLDDWSGVAVRTVFGEAPSASGDIAMNPDAMETLRVERGIPKMGSELDENTIPAAAGVVERSVSFTKGCYTGQELVARIDSRGNNVPRRLVGLVSPTALAAGANMEDGEGKKVGHVTSATHSDRLEAHVGLGYLARSVDVDAEVQVEGAGQVVVRALPLVAS